VGDETPAQCCAMCLPEIVVSWHYTSVACALW